MYPKIYLKIKNKSSNRILYIFLLSIALLSHLTYLPNGFTWLEHRDIEQKRAVLPIKEFPKAFLKRYGDTGFYRPIVTIANSIDFAIYGNYAPGYHMTNLLIFLMVIAVIPFFFKAIFSLTFSQSIIASLIVAIHPFGFLPIGSISYRPELLLTLYTILTLYFHKKTREKKKPVFRLLTTLCFFGALFSKETALFLLPALILLWEFSIVPSSERKSLERDQKKNINKKKFYPILLSSFMVSKLLFLIEIAILVTYLIFRFTAVPELWRTTSYFPSLSAAIGTRLFIVGKLLILFLSPFITPINDVVPITPVNNPISLVVLVFFIFISLLVYPLLLKEGQNEVKKVKFSLVFFLLTLLPALSIIPVPRMGSTHYGFIALIPFGAVVVLLLNFLFLSRKERFNKNLKSIMLVGVSLWFFVSGFSTLQNGYRFKNDETLFLPEVVNNTYYPEAQFYLGNYYFAQKQYSKAEKAYTTALNVKPNFTAYSDRTSIFINLAGVYMAEEKYILADEKLRDAQILVPPSKQWQVIYNRAIIAGRVKNYQKIVTLLTKDVPQNDPASLLLLADAFHNLGKNNQAVSVLKKLKLGLNKKQKQQLDLLIYEYTKDQ